jgi:ferrous iron transport protein A
MRDVKPGEMARILKLRCRGMLSQRLMDMGFVPGKKFKVVRSAPLFDPIEIQLGQYCVNIRREEAQWVEVEPA